MPDLESLGQAKPVSHKIGVRLLEQAGVLIDNHTILSRARGAGSPVNCQSSKPRRDTVR